MRLFRRGCLYGTFLPSLIWMLYAPYAFAYATIVAANFLQLFKMFKCFLRTPGSIVLFSSIKQYIKLLLLLRFLLSVHIFLVLLRFLQQFLGRYMPLIHFHKACA